MAATEPALASQEMHRGISVVIERPPEAVFAALTDVASHTDWARGPDEISNVSDNPARLGTTWQQTTKLAGKKIVSTMKVNAYEENHKLGFGSDKPFPMQILFTVTPTQGGTELRMTAHGQPTGILGKVALPILVRSLERQMESDLYSLKGILEDGA